MSATRRLVSPVVKEVRALAIPWAACLVAMIEPAIADSPRFLGGLSVPAYFVATAALGALSIGHEYTSGTLSLLLSLPVQRTRLLAIKLGVLAAMLLVLWVVATTLVFGDARLPQTIRQTASSVPLLGGLFLAPWLTMWCRSALGGAVFTIAIEGMLYVIGELIGTKLYGHGALMEAFRLAVVWYGTIALCVIAGVATWGTFVRLEAIEGFGRHLRLPEWPRGLSAPRSRTAHFTRRHPIWMVVRKELHLQQLALALAALFVLGASIALWMTRRSVDPIYGSVLSALTFLYAGSLPLLIGASASAGERQIGTLEWQILQPLAAWKQWSIKLAVVFGLVIVLTVGLLMLWSSLGRPLRFPGTFTDSFESDGWVFMAVILLTAGSVYVSSLCRSALWALVMSIPAAMVSTSLFQFAWYRIARPTYRVAMRSAMQLLPSESLGAIDDTRIMNWLTLMLIAGFVALTLRLAFTNHRSADRPSVRTWRQPAILAAFVIGAVILHATATGVIVANNLLRLPPQFRSR